MWRVIYPERRFYYLHFAVAFRMLMTSFSRFSCLTSIYYQVGTTYGRVFFTNFVSCFLDVNLFENIFQRVFSPGATEYFFFRPFGGLLIGRFTVNVAVIGAVNAGGS